KHSPAAAVLQPAARRWLVFRPGALTMRRQWLTSLYRSWGIRKNSRRRQRSLQFDTLEDRAVPTTVSFQQGTGGYASGLQLHIRDYQPNTTVTSGYYLDGFDGSSVSPNEWDLLRFSNLFTSQG